jgi:23S rRNA pseudouridine2457 synthase
LPSEGKRWLAKKEGKVLNAQGLNSNRGTKVRTFTIDPKRHYIAFYKPYGVLCQFSQPADSDKQTLSEFGFPKNVYSIGRLDYDSEGLILLTDDRRLNSLLLDPRNQHWRTYLVQVENEPTMEGLDRIRTGFELGTQRTLPAQVSTLTEPPELKERPIPIRFRKSIPTCWLRLSLAEGKNRQVRRMTAAIGCPTLRLVRVAIGALTLQDLNLEPGKWRALQTDELSRVFKGRRPI